MLALGYDRIIRGCWWLGLKTDVELYCRSVRCVNVVLVNALCNSRMASLPCSMYLIDALRFSLWMKCLIFPLLNGVIARLGVLYRLAIQWMQWPSPAFCWGLPRKIVSDRDPLIAGEVYQTLCRLWNVTRLNISSARSAQTDGHSESAVEAIS